MNIKLLSILIILFSIIGCNPSVRKQISDEDFQTFLSESKKHVEEYPDSALIILHGLLPLQQGEGKAVNRGWVLNLIGSSFDTKGMYDSAAYYLYEASRLAEKTKDDSLQMSVFSNLGILHFAMKNAAEAVKYYQQSLAIADKLKDSIAITHQLNNIGNAYMTLTNEFEKAIPYFEQCREISTKIKYVPAYKVAGINLAMMYNELGEHDKALQEIKHLTKQYGDNIYADFTLGVIYYKKGNYKEAIHEWKGLLKKSLNTREFEFTLLNNIADVYRLVGNLDSAVVYMEKLFTLRDSLHNQQTTKTIHDLKIAYETEKKEMRIATLESEKQQMIWLSITGGGVLLLTLATLFFLWRWTVQKKRFSEQQVRRLEQEKQLVATQALLNGEMQERTRLARDLHDGLGGILAAAKYNLTDIQKTSPTELINIEFLDKAVSLLDESMREMRRVAHHLMPESLARCGLKQAIADFCQSIPSAKFVYYGDEARLDPKMDVIIYRIMHELVTNVLKHSGASHILVQIVQEPDRIAFTVQDNGCGFDTSKESKGMGLESIRTRVAAYNGNLLIDSIIGMGTEVNVELQLR